MLKVMVRIMYVTYEKPLTLTSCDQREDIR